MATIKEQADAVKAKLAPWVNEPYFDRTPEWLAVTTTRCTHVDEGVRLDEVDRRAYCKTCGLQLDPFQALVHYAKAEERLVATRRAIDDAHRRETDRAAREKASRPFVRKVMDWTEIKDVTLKAEPLTGYLLTLACGHTAKCGTRRVRQKTCWECRDAEREAERLAERNKALGLGAGRGSFVAGKARPGEAPGG